jgi:hypothetical protein
MSYVFNIETVNIKQSSRDGQIVLPEALPCRVLLSWHPLSNVSEGATHFESYDIGFLIRLRNFNIV